MSIRILVGDCRETLKSLPDASVDSVVCDPPYHLTNRTVDVKGCKDCGRTLGGSDGKPTVCPRCGGELSYQRSQQGKGFMGQTWDGGDVAFQAETWAEVLRVLKPGGHLIAFSGTRTYHRMAVAIEDAGFEVRDQLAWVYGSGFPKSHDVAQGIEKRLTTGKDRRECRTLGLDRNRFSGSKEGTLIADTGGKIDLTTEAAQQWQGWGTALKPAWEPICLARRPLVGTVAANVLVHGTGALNIDGCRVETSDAVQSAAGSVGFGAGRDDAYAAGTGREYGSLGRWPANICHDGSDEVLAGFPSEAGGGYGVQGGKVTGEIYARGGRKDVGKIVGHGDSGSAARFFYCAKTTTEERGEGNNHPTVKPQALMRWLCRLVTPPSGTVLDPFAGSGSTLIAADAEQFHAIGCELSPDYAAIAEQRLRNAGGMFCDVKVAA